MSLTIIIINNIIMLNNVSVFTFMIGMLVTIVALQLVILLKEFSQC